MIRAPLSAHSSEAKISEKKQGFQIFRVDAEVCFPLENNNVYH